MSGYYDDWAAHYFARTVGIDAGRFLTPLVRVLPPGARVLDVGCGSGRDLRWLRAQGFAVTGLERAAALAARARVHAGCPVVEGDFETFDFTALPADAILLVGALVHVAPERLPAVLQRILGALGPWSAGGGWVYLSLKQGRGERQDPAGRRFYLWQDDALQAIFETLGLAAIDLAVSASAAGTGERWLGYVLRRTDHGGRCR